MGGWLGAWEWLGGLCYSETFKAELSLVILCLTCQKAPLTLKLVLLNSCMVPQLMCTSINKRCFWRRGRYLLTFIHTKPIMTVQSKPPLKIKKKKKIRLLYPQACEWLLCSGAVELLLPGCKQSSLRWLIRCCFMIIHWCHLLSWPLTGIIENRKKISHFHALFEDKKEHLFLFYPPSPPIIKCTKWY